MAGGELQLRVSMGVSPLPQVLQQAVQSWSLLMPTPQ
jgi:hypothetical protein